MIMMRGEIAGQRGRRCLPGPKVASRLDKGNTTLATADGKPRRGRAQEGGEGKMELGLTFVSWINSDYAKRNSYEKYIYILDVSTQRQRDASRLRSARAAHHLIAKISHVARISHNFSLTQLAMCGPVDRWTGSWMM